ncbi:alpha/beta-hydrolase [Serendipita vermifera]|nr:alpha/beta-hydrolase [Serendipita vermifera]
MPTTPYGPDWQAYYKVDTASLTGVNFPLPNTYAGSVSVNREGHEDNTLFFVAFEKEGQEGSLTAADEERSNEPWAIWLNGGPGSSSMYGLFEENGPIRYALPDDATTVDQNVASYNPYSWHNLTDIIYVDQPVGTGYSTVDSTGYIIDEEMMGRDFVGFLSNIVAIFPSLKKRPLYITGESYAGVYIPYITKTIVNMDSPPVTLAKIAIGDGAMGNWGAFSEYSAISILQTYPQLINFNTTVYEYFVEQFNLCGYNLTLQYPSPSVYPTLRPFGRLTEGSAAQKMFEGKTKDALSRLSTVVQLLKLHDSIPEDVQEITVKGRRFRKRQSTNDTQPGLPNLSPRGSIDPYYECYVIESIENYASKYISPWAEGNLDVYSLANVISPPPPNDAGPFLNDPAVRAALHAPNKTWQLSIAYPFNNTRIHTSLGGNLWGDTSPEPQVFLSDLAVHVPIVFYSGNDDALVGHRGTELAIQNMTFGGIRGFTARPSTPFSDTDGNFAGIVHQERNVTYALFYGAGHMVPTDKPKAAYAFLREFVLGNNQTGLLTTSGGTTNIVGGVHTEYLKGILPGSSAVTGRYVPQGTYTWPQASWDAWGSYMATRTEADVPVASATGDGIISPGSQDQSHLGTPNNGLRQESSMNRIVLAVFCLVGSLTLA